MRKFILSLCLVGAIFCTRETRAELPINIVPEPAQVSGREGVFLFTDSTRFVIQSADTSFAGITRLFLNEFNSASGFNLKSDSLLLADQQENLVTIRWQKTIQREGYHLDISSKAIIISASEPAGLFYAFQSLRQLMPTEFFRKKKEDEVYYKKWKIPCADIVDFPRFPYRGMHLDVSRHFFSLDYLKKYLDILAAYKINTFHWHLTDSHGWRLEIKKYPKLTSVGAWRADRKGIPMTIAEPTGPNEKADYGGFYTQDQVKDLIHYASERFITVIPEIEMPGHATAALVAYPQFTCLNNPVPLLMPCGYAGDLRHNFCAGNDSTFLFLQDVLDEVMALFPNAPYIHIGGDEVKPESWLTCPRCQQRMKTEGLTNWRQLQSYFTRRIDEYVSSKGRKVIGWDEIMQAGISQNAGVMSWHGDKWGVAAAEASHPVVMAPYRFVYFDFYQSDPDLEPDISYAGLNLQQVYNFEPLSPGLDKEQAQYILGGQACLWTENVETPARVEYMLLPRLFALSESLWSPTSVKDYRKLINKTEYQFARLDVQNINYAKSIFNVHIRPEYDSTSGTIKVTLEDQTGGKHIIRYCDDGKNISAANAIYTGPFVVKETGDIRAALYEQDTQLGKTSIAHVTIAPSTGRKVEVAAASADSTMRENVRRLTDGLQGSIEPDDGQWVRFSDSVTTITVDLKNKRKLSSISFRCMEDMVGNTFLPKRLTVSLSSDNKKFREVYQVQNEKLPVEKLRHIKEYGKTKLSEDARFVRIQILSTIQVNPENKTPNSVLIDEVVVE